MPLTFRDSAARRSAKVGARLGLALLSLAAVGAHAAQVLDVNVARDDASFLIGMRIAIDASPSDVFRALRDYAAMPRYNPDLRTLRVEQTSDPNRVRLFTTIHTCVLFFCKTMNQEQVMTATASSTGGTLQAELVPENGAFSGEGHWIVRRCRVGQASTCVDIHLVLIPQFWMPPVIGPWLIRKKMNEEAQQSSLGLEQVARQTQ